MKQIKIKLALVLCLACAVVSCGGDEDDEYELPIPSETVTSVTVVPSSEDEGVLVGEGLTFKITSFPDNTAGVYGTTKEVDKNPYTGGFVIPAHISYNGKIFTVKSIGKNAFKGFYKMTSVSIPETITTIDDGAFLECRGLTEISIIDLRAWCMIDFEAHTTCSTMPHYAASRGNLYLNGELIKNLKIPSGLTKIKYGTFCRLYDLESVEIPRGIDEIESQAFYECRNLKYLSLPEGLQNIQSEAFSGCKNLQKIVCKALTPPECYGEEYDFYNDIYNSFFNCFNATLIVPSGTLWSYRNTYPWYKFNNIQEGAENL